MVREAPIAAGMPMGSRPQLFNVAAVERLNAQAIPGDRPGVRHDGDPGQMLRPQLGARGAGRKSRPALKLNSKSPGDAAGLVISPTQFTVVIDVGGDALIELHGKAGAEQQAVAAGSRPVDEEARSRAVRKAGIDAEDGVAVFVLPAGPHLRFHQNAPKFPVIADFRSEGAANRFLMLIGKIQRRQ
jgi:hypothetical protein